MDDQDRYRPSKDATALAQAMMPPPGALPARPVRNPKHKRGASFGGIPFAQLESLPSWTQQESRENMIMAWKTAAADDALQADLPLMLPRKMEKGWTKRLATRRVSPNPAAAFLKDATGARTTGNPRKKRNRNRRRRITVPVLQSAAVSPPSSESQCKQTTTMGPPPCTPHCPQTRGFPYQ
ncbi:hypothetical protein MRX96_030000 [Rhipicephalus microplus]